MVSLNPGGNCSLKAYLSGRVFSTAGVNSSVAGSATRWRMWVLGSSGLGPRRKRCGCPSTTESSKSSGEGELAPDAEDGAEGQVAGDRHREEAVERPRRVGGGAGDGEEARGGGGQGQRERERAAAVEAEREAAREVR